MRVRQSVTAQPASVEAAGCVEWPGPAVVTQHDARGAAVWPQSVGTRKGGTQQQ